MDPDLEKRINLAWRECGVWIAEFDGSPTITLLVDVPLDALLPGLRALSERSPDLRITVISSEKAVLPHYVGLETIPEQLSRLESGETAELSVNFGLYAPAFDLDLHLLVHLVKPGTAALELAWWSDQVFSSETDNASQFQSLAGYFIELQRLFAAGGVFISPESGMGDEEAWVEL